MKTFLLSLCVLCALCGLPGCGSELTAGGVGLGAGLGLSETFKGMQADLAQREAALVEKYNQLHDAGAKAEVLEDVRRQLEQTVQLRQGVETTERVMGVDWSDPAAAGGAIGLLGTLAWTWLSKRKVATKYVAMKAGQAQLKVTDPAAEAKLYAAVGVERAKLGL